MVVAVALIFFLLLACVFGIAGGGWYFMAQQTAAARQAEIEMQFAMKESMLARDIAEKNKVAELKLEELQREAKFAAEMEIAIDEQGNLFHLNKPTTLEELRTLLGDRQADESVEVQIIAARETPFRFVAEVMQVCSEFEGVEANVGLSPPAESAPDSNE